ncbi:hypothetical protein INR49_009187 [Caranx melampygus]|nr:hypothetical protein INR49_009187 [Caranx melampygus]
MDSPATATARDQKEEKGGLYCPPARPPLCSHRGKYSLPTSRYQEKLIPSLTVVEFSLVMDHVA